MNVDPKILSKIKKCLALSASSNENEAAIALRQAQRLMAEFGGDRGNAHWRRDRHCRGQVYGLHEACRLGEPAV